MRISFWMPVNQAPLRRMQESRSNHFDQLRCPALCEALSQLLVSLPDNLPFSETFHSAANRREGCTMVPFSRQKKEIPAYGELRRVQKEMWVWLFARPSARTIIILEVSNDFSFNNKEDMRSRRGILYCTCSCNLSRPRSARSSLELRRQGGSKALGFARSRVRHLQDGPQPVSHRRQPPQARPPS